MNINLTVLGQSFPIVLLACLGIFFARRFIKNRKLANKIASTLIAILLLPYLLALLLVLTFSH